MVAGDKTLDAVRHVFPLALSVSFYTGDGVEYDTQNIKNALQCPSLIHSDWGVEEVNPS